MFRKYYKPVTGATLGGILGWMLARGFDRKDDATYAPYFFLTLAFAMVGGTIGVCCNKTYVDVAASNQKLLAHLDDVYTQAYVPLLTQCEFDSYCLLIQNRNPAELKQINLQIEKYQAAINEICPNSPSFQKAGDITYPITLIAKNSKARNITYDYSILRMLISRNPSYDFFEINSGLELNRINFSFQKNHVPEVMEFVNEVRTTLSKRLPLPPLSPGKSSPLIFYSINPATSCLSEPTQDSYGSLTINIRGLRT
jgi:hypothetical protein